MSDSRGGPARMTFSGSIPGRGGGPAGGPPGHGLGMPGEKAKDVSGTLRKLVPYLKASRALLSISFLAAIAATIFSVLGPKLLGNATTLLVRGLTDKGGVDFAAIARILVLLGCLYVLSSAFIFLQQYLMAGVAQKLVFALRRDVQAKLSRLPLAFFDGRPLGEIMSRTTNDIDSISTTLQQSLTQLMTSVITIVGTLVMMLFISPVLTLIAVGSLPLAILATTLVAKHSRDYFKTQQRALGELTGHVEESFSGHVVVKAFGREKETIAVFREVNDRLYRSGVRAQFVSGLIMPLMQLINNSGYVLVCVVGGAMAARRALDIGDIQAFLQYLRQFTMPIVQTATIANVLQSTIASAERVFSLLDEKEETADAGAGGRGSRFSHDGAGGLRSTLLGPRGSALRAGFVPLQAGRAADRGSESRCRAGEARRDRWTHRRGKDDAREPADALLRDRFGARDGGRPRHPRASARRAPVAIRHGAPGRVAFQRDDKGKYRVREGGCD